LTSYCVVNIKVSVLLLFKIFVIQFIGPLFIVHQQFSFVFITRDMELHRCNPHINLHRCHVFKQMFRPSFTYPTVRAAMHNYILFRFTTHV
jgi:hypothetical protein